MPDERVYRSTGGDSAPTLIEDEKEKMVWQLLWALLVPTSQCYCSLHIRMLAFWPATSMLTIKLCVRHPHVMWGLVHGFSL